MFKFIKTTYKAYRTIRRTTKVVDSELYYKDLNEIPLFNWWKCSKGEYEYMWKEKQKWVPIFFPKVFNQMYYQLDYIDLDELRKLVKANLYDNRYLSTKNIKWKRKADTVRAEVELLMSNVTGGTKLNDMIKFVQRALNLSFYLDSTKISAGYFFNLYAEAKKIAETNGNN